MSTNLGTATYTIRVVDEFSRGHRQFREEMKKTEQQSYIMRRAMSVATGIIVAAVIRMGTTSAMEAAKAAAAFNQLNLTFNNLASDGQVNLASLRESTMGMVSDMDLLKSANEALLRGLPTDKLAEMFKIGATLATSKGMETAEGINAIVDGVGKMREEYLKNIGITMTMSEAYKIYANQLGITTSQLTDSQKQQAALNLALERGEEALIRSGAAIDPLNRSYQEARANLSNFLNVVGTGILVIGQGFFAVVNDAADAWENFNQAIKNGEPILLNAAKGIMKTNSALYNMAELLGLIKEPLDIPLTDEEIDLALETDNVTESLVKAAQTLDEYAKSMGFASQKVHASYLNLYEYADALERTTRNQDEANDSVSDALKALNVESARMAEVTRLTDEYNSTLKELELQQSDLSNAIRYASGATNYYRESTDYSNWSNQEAVSLHKQLTGSLAPLERRYSKLGDEIDKYNKKLMGNNRLISRNRLEYMILQDAIQDRQDVAQSQVDGIDKEIQALKLLGAMQGYLTFNQRRQFNVLNERKNQMEDNVDTTESEESALRSLDAEYRNLSITQSQLNMDMSDLTSQYNKLGTQISTYTDRINTLVDAMTNYISLLQESLDLEKQITDKGGSTTTGGGTTPSSTTRKEGVFHGAPVTPIPWGWNLPKIPAQNGFNGEVAKPTLFLAGEAGKEYVSITPQGKGTQGGAGTGGGTNNFDIDFNISGVGGGESEKRILAKQLSGMFIDELHKRGVKIY